MNYQKELEYQLVIYQK